MARTRRQFDGKFKSKIALEAITGLRRSKKCGIAAFGPSITKEISAFPLRRLRKMQGSLTANAQEACCRRLIQ